MKRLGILALVASAAFFASSFAAAQDDYLPLVQEETISIVRADLSKIDGQQLSKLFQKTAAGVVDAFVQDKEQADQLKQALPLVGMMIAQNVATYVKPLQEVGVKYVYAVIEQPKDDALLYPYLAIPTKDLSKEQVAKLRDCLKELNQALNSSIKYRFERNGFMIVLLIPNTVEADEAKAYAKNRFAKFNTVEKPEFAKGFKAGDPNAAFVSVSLSSRNDAMIQKQLDSVATMLDSAEGAEEVAEVVKNSLNEFNALSKEASKCVSFAAVSVNLDAPSVSSKIQAKSADAAKKYVELNKVKAKEAYSKLLAGLLESKTISETPIAENVEELESLLNELYDVFSQYEADGDVIALKYDENFFNNSKPTFDKVVAFVAKLVEKAKEAAEAEEATEE